MLIAKPILLGVVLPAVLSGLWLLPAWRRRDDTVSDSGRWVGPLALATAYIAGHVGTLGWPPFPAIEANQWVAWFTIVAAVMGVVEAARAVPAWRQWMLRVLLLAATLWLVLRPMVDYSWEPGQAVLWIGGIGALALGLWVELELVLPRLSPAAGWLTLLLQVSGGAAALAMSGSLALGLLAGGLAAGVGAALVLSLVLGGRPITATVIPVPGLVLTGLLTAGYFYSELPALSALLVAASPLAALLAAVAMRGRAPLLTVAVQATAQLVAIVVALTLAGF